MLLLLLRLRLRRRLRGRLPLLGCCRCRCRLALALVPALAPACAPAAATASAGLLLRAGGSVERLSTGGVALAMFEGSAFESGFARLDQLVQAHERRLFYYGLVLIALFGGFLCVAALLMRRRIP